MEEDEALLVNPSEIAASENNFTVMSGSDTEEESEADHKSDGEGGDSDGADDEEDTKDQAGLQLFVHCAHHCCRRRPACCPPGP